MGWKTVYSVGEDYFKQLYEAGQKWGDFLSYKLTVEGVVHYGAGYASSSPTGWVFSPKIQHQIGKTRIKVKYYVWIGANATGKADIGIVFYKNDTSSKDEQGYDVHGVEHTVSTAPTESTAEGPHELLIEQENNKITYYVDGTKLGEAVLEPPLTSFKLVIAIPEVSGGELGIIVTEVTEEYYDYMEDMINMFINIMNIMTWVMVFIVLITSVIKAFRRKK